MHQLLLHFAKDVQIELFQKRIVIETEKAVYERLQNQELGSFARAIVALQQANHKLDTTLGRIVDETRAVHAASMQTHDRLNRLIELLEINRRDEDAADWWKRSDEDDDCDAA